MFTNLELQAMEGKHLQLIPRTLAMCGFIKRISQEFTQLHSPICHTEISGSKSIFFHLRLDTVKSNAINGP